jgi:23S rRNA (guanosine2251-2'-O)-methyltransferase
MSERGRAAERRGATRSRPRPRGEAGSAAEVLVGRNAVREALLARRRRVRRVLLAEGVQDRGSVEELLTLCGEASVPVERVPRAALDRLGGELTHQGVAARVSSYPYADLDALLARAEERGEAPFLLALDSLQDPQNVGSLLRTAEAVGVHGVIVPERRAAGVTPAVSRASAGAVEHLLVARVTNLVRALEDLKERGVWVVGVEDVPSAQDYRRVDLSVPLILVVGGEGPGIRRLVLETCDLLVRLPMRGHIASLNVSVAGSIVLYQAWGAQANSGAVEG